jgi:hypothetical protein
MLTSFVRAFVTRIAKYVEPDAVSEAVRAMADHIKLVDQRQCRRCRRCKGRLFDCRCVRAQNTSARQADFQYCSHNSLLDIVAKQNAKYEI